MKEKLKPLDVELFCVKMYLEDIEKIISIIEKEYGNIRIVFNNVSMKPDEISEYRLRFK